MQTIYATREAVPAILAEISRQQTSKKVFIAVDVKPYNGNKYRADVKITIG